MFGPAFQLNDTGTSISGAMLYRYLAVSRVLIRIVLLWLYLYPPGYIILGSSATVCNRVHISVHLGFLNRFVAF